MLGPISAAMLWRNAILGEAAFPAEPAHHRGLIALSFWIAAIHSAGGFPP